MNKLSYLYLNIEDNLLSENSAKQHLELLTEFRKK